MGKEEAALLEAIKEEATGGSDTREVYADWLEEQGRSEQAEYLRLEVEVRGFEFITGDPERVQKKARRDELEDRLEKSDPKWLADVSRAAGVRVARPRPTGALGRAVPIESASLPPSEPDLSYADIANLSAPRSPLHVTGYPELPKPRRRGRLIIEIMIAIALVLIVRDITTKGWAVWSEEVVEDYYFRDGHR